VCIKLHNNDATLSDISGNGNDATRVSAPTLAFTEPLVFSLLKRRRV